MTLPDLFPKIVQTNSSLQGWCGEEKAITLASIIIATRCSVSLEVGVYGGRSFFPMAFAHQSIRHGKCIGVDPWSKEVAVREQTTEKDREWWGKLDIESIRLGVESFITEHKLDNYCQIIRRESRYVDPPSAIGLLHLDGSHSDTAVGDVIKFAPRVTLGGFCVTDDSNWAGGGVTRAERRLQELGFKKICALQDGALWQRLR